MEWGFILLQPCGADVPRRVQTLLPHCRAASCAELEHASLSAGVFLVRVVGSDLVGLRAHAGVALVQHGASFAPGERTVLAATRGG